MRWFRRSEGVHDLVVDGKSLRYCEMVADHGGYRDDVDYWSGWVYGRPSRHGASWSGASLSIVAWQEGRAGIELG